MELLGDAAAPLTTLVRRPPEGGKERTEFRAGATIKKKLLLIY